MQKPLFPLGQVVSTPGAIEAFTDEGSGMLTFIHRHVTGDWGDICADDKRENYFAVTRELRIFSAPCPGPK